MNSQGSVQLSQVFDPSPAADKQAFSEALQINQAKDRFACGSSIRNQNIRGFEIIVVNAIFVKRAEQLRQAFQKDSPSGFSGNGFQSAKFVAPKSLDSLCS